MILEPMRTLRNLMEVKQQRTKQMQYLFESAGIDIWLVFKFNHFIYKILESMISSVTKKGLTGMDDSDDETFHDKQKFKQVNIKELGGKTQSKVGNFIDDMFGTKPKPKPPKPVDPKPDPKPVDPKPVEPKPKPVQPAVKQIERPITSDEGDFNTYETPRDIPNNQFNRPAYIRKFKKIAQNYNYRFKNESHVEVDNVLRIGECYYDHIKKLCQTGFVDSEFPTNYTAFVDNSKERQIGFYKDYNNWRKPKEVCNSPALGKYIDPNDVVQGLFSSQFLASCISTLAENQKNIKRLIEQQTYNEMGFYYSRINVNGVWRYVVVDQFLPTHTDGRLIPTHSNLDDETDLWPTIIEKAYTKVYGSYEQYSRPQSRECYLRDLTGAPVKIYSPANPNLIKIIETAVANNWPIQAVPTDRILDKGLNPNYTLGVLKASGKSIQFRNSFGSVDQRPRINMSKDGVFEVSVDEARNLINYFMVAEVYDDYFTSTVQAKHKASYYSSYSFHVSKDFHGFVMVSQFDNRLFNQPNNLYATQSKIKVGNKNHYETSPIRLLIYKREGEYRNYVASGYAASKNLDVEVNLKPGDYEVFVAANWLDRDYDVNLSIYGTELASLRRIYNKKNPSVIAEGLQFDAVREGSKTTKGSVDQYTYLDSAGGFIVVTCVNTTSKPTRYVKDFGRIKSQGILLLNERNKYDSNPSKAESTFAQKQWSIDLEPSEKYTWVFATHRPVDQSSLKALGFK